MSETINHFSLISRLFGNLFFRSPTDPVLAGVFQWLQNQGLSQVWALETDKASQQALDDVQRAIDLNLLQAEYEKLFGNLGKINTALSAYGVDLAAFVAFRQERDMPVLDNPDHFGLLLLTASWIEDNLDSQSAQQALFEEFLLPCASKFLNTVETQATLPFYRSLALLTREILAATADELEETAEQ